MDALIGDEALYFALGVGVMASPAEAVPVRLRAGGDQRSRHLARGDRTRGFY